ncbi:NADH:flavin oxidoreductase [Clostridium botulinum]|uniref:NADH:flavin oxidoreductase n=1 Tax=Clostridium botulinum TaxID=1491 RepID=UPI00174ACD75|nr:NADH:flavin oxidoreductase [Clostridium botulinum]MBD5639932.1 NADH:flavin oxidoreductase [Clostridium botulinum]
MKSLFDKTCIKTMELKNRFVRSATWEGMATEEGHITKRLLNLYEELAKGGVGLIITSYTTIFDYDKPSLRILGIYDDSFIEEYKLLTDTIHKYGAKVLMQIVLGENYINNKTGSEFYGLSENMPEDDIKAIVKSFAEAAKRAKKSGFDGIQIHGAHGYFLSRTLSPLFNKRKDEYGGSEEKRGTLILEIYDEIRKTVGEDFHISIKINSSDFEEGGATFKECEFVCRELSKKGIDSIEISGGGTIWTETNKKESIYKEYASKIAEQIDTPIILVGMNRSYNNMDQILNNSKIEYFSMARPFIREPDLINKFEKDENKKAKCISCGKCYGENGIRCIFNM